MKKMGVRAAIIIVSALVIAAAAVTAIAFLPEKNTGVRGPETAPLTESAPSDTAKETAPETETEAATETDAPTETETEAVTGTETGTEAVTEAEPEPVFTGSEGPAPEFDPSFGTKTDSAERSAGAAGEDKIVLTFAGDMMLAEDRLDPGVPFNDYADRLDPSYFLSEAAPYFRSDDFTVANLENVFSDRDLAPIDKGYYPAYWYKSASKNTAILTSSGVDAVTIANNHTWDYGAEGMSDTASALISAGVDFGSNDRTFYYEKNGFRIAFICHGLWSEWDADGIIPRIAEASAVSDFQIVYYHGGTEYEHSPEEWRVRACRRLVDAGADCVIGSHPHVIQPIGRYRGVDLVYSLGNFLAGDFKTCENRTFLYRLTINVTGGTVVSTTSDVVPFYVYSGGTNDLKPVPITDPAVAGRVRDFIDWKVGTPD